MTVKKMMWNVFGPPRIFQMVSTWTRLGTSISSHQPGLRYLGSLTCIHPESRMSSKHDLKQSRQRQQSIHPIWSTIRCLQTKTGIQTATKSAVSVATAAKLQERPPQTWSTSGLHTTEQKCSDDTKSLVIWQNLKELKSSPVPALMLGLSGLIPFVAAPVYLVLNQNYDPSIAFAQIAYGATILSFLGGVRWGLTLPEESYIRPDWINLGYSVTPSLIAWVGLLLPNQVSILTLIGGLGLAAYFDMAMFGYPAWFKGLRFLLSFIAVLSLWTTFMCHYFLEAKKEEKQEVPK